MKLAAKIASSLAFALCTAAACAQAPPGADTIFRDPQAAAMADSLARGDVNGALRGRSQGISPNVRGAGGVRPIHYVAAYAHDRSLGSLRALIAAGADVEAADDRGRTPLGIASARPTPEAVQILLGSRAKASTPSAGELPALIAARSGNSVGFQLLALSGTPLSGPASREGSLAAELASAGLFDNLLWLAQRGMVDNRSMRPSFWAALCSGQGASARSAAAVLGGQAGGQRCR